MKTSKKVKIPHISARIFFLGYFSVITVILLWNLFHCTEVSWSTADALSTEVSDSAAQTNGGNSTQQTPDSKAASVFELKDDSPLTVRAAEGKDKSESSANTYGKKPRLKGVALLGYKNTRSLLFSDETVTAEVVNIRTQEVAGSGTLLLKNQTIYPNDETIVYIALSEPVTQLLPEGLEIRFHTSGLTRNGIFIIGGTAGKGEEPPLVRLYYEKKKWNPAMPLLYYILEMFSGLGCLLLYGERKLPLLRRDRAERLSDAEIHSSPADGSGKTAARKKFREQAGKPAAAAVAILFVAVLMLYTYMHAVKKTADACGADLLTGGTKAADVVRLSPGMTLRQKITAGQDMLSGIGIRPVQENGDSLMSPKDAAYAEAGLEWALLDETGTAVLTSGAGKVKDLKKVSAVLAEDIKDQKVLNTADISVRLAFDSPVREAAGKQFVLQISYPEQSGTQEDVCFLATGDTNGQIETATEKGFDASGTGQETLPLELGLMGVYKNNGFLKGMYLRISAAVLVMLAGLYFALCRFRVSGARTGKQTAALYLVSALCMGLMFSFITPVYTISDERTHIDSVYFVSNRLLGISDLPGPNRLLKRACDINSSIANTMPVTADRYRAVEEDLFRAAPKTGAGMSHAGEAGEDGSAGNARLPSGRELTAAYTRSALDNVPVLCYLASAVGFSFARLLGRNMITMIMAARWLNLLSCVLIMYLAIRRMPYGAPAMAVIGLFPKTLQQMASCSYDGMVIAGTFLFIALSLTAAFDEDVCLADLLAMILSGLFVAACKGGAYLPVLGMALMIPAVRAGKGKKMKTGWLMVSGAAVGTAVLLFVGKYVLRLISMFGRVSGTATVAAGTKTLYTLSDFIHAPVKLVRIYINTFAVRADGLLGELVGKNLSQKWYIVYAFLLLALLGMLRTDTARREKEPGQEKNHLRIPGRLWLLFLTSVSVSLVFLSMLLAFTEKGATYIDGLQGRYFLPVAPLPFLALENGLVKRDGIPDVALLYAADVLLAVTFCEILLMYLRGI